MFNVKCKPENRSNNSKSSSASAERCTQYIYWDIQINITLFKPIFEWPDRTHNIFMMNIQCVSVFSFLFIFLFISFLFPFIQFRKNIKYDWTSSSLNNNNSASKTQDKFCLGLFVSFTAVVVFLVFLIFLCQMWFSIHESKTEFILPR